MKRNVAARKGAASRITSADSDEELIGYPLRIVVIDVNRKADLIATVFCRAGAMRVISVDGERLNIASAKRQSGARIAEGYGTAAFATC